MSLVLLQRLSLEHTYICQWFPHRPLWEAGPQGFWLAGECVSIWSSPSCVERWSKRVWWGATRWSSRGRDGAQVLLVAHTKWSGVSNHTLLCVCGGGGSNPPAYLYTHTHTHMATSMCLASLCCVKKYSVADLNGFILMKLHWSELKWWLKLKWCN